MYYGVKFGHCENVNILLYQILYTPENHKLLLSEYLKFTSSYDRTFITSEVVIV